MRLWSLHPHYLDPKGLVAVWREGLLAQQVLLGKTRGYRNHPQLVRFCRHPDPIGAINYYLDQIYLESVQRGYRFDRSKVAGEIEKIEKISVTTGQLKFELFHLQCKVKKRAPSWRFELAQEIPEANLLFEVGGGNIESWEKV